MLQKARRQSLVDPVSCIRSTRWSTSTTRTEIPPEAKRFGIESERIDSRLVVDALEMALARQCPGADLPHAHSDRDVQYASEHYQSLLTKHGITCSMSRKGNCWDNAPMESFFATLKKELVHHEEYRSRAAARQNLFEYIEVFYNRIRRHSALGYQSPAQFSEAA